MYCQNCGVEYTNDSNFCFSCGHSFNKNTNLERTSYAGFWRRLVAIVIDYFILSIPYNVRTFIYPVRSHAELIFWLGYTVIGVWLYNALMESSSNQGTIGKITVRIKVVDKNGNKISFGRATARYFSKITILLTIYIGALMIAFTNKKQSLHDMMAGCLVVNK